MNKTCSHCSAQFEITQDDLVFYDKISPVFKGKKYSMPIPSFCPDCRQQRRLSFRNERKLYKRNCDASGKQIISIYSPVVRGPEEPSGSGRDKPYKVYDQKIWWSDSWNPLDYGRDFDFSRGFFDQFDELMKNIPLLALTALFDSENSDYVTFSGKLKDCYMIMASWICEKTMYSSRLINTNYVMDCLDGTNLEKCYQTYNCEGLYGCFYCMNSHNCSNSYFLYDCSNCSDCFLCYNLVGKKYYIENKEYSKDEYFEKISILKNELFNKGWKALEKIKSKAINKNLMIINSDNSIGDNIKNCKNCFNIFHIERAENCKYLENGGMVCSNVYDGLGIGENFDLGYELLDTGVNAILTCFGITCYTCNNSFYNINCHNSSNLFGCIGLRNKSYCILNKQYTKEQYEELVPKIIEHMINWKGKGEREKDKGSGIDYYENGEWGEFFPSSISPFGYNETVAQEYFPLTKDEAISKGFNWSDYEAPFPNADKIIPGERLPDDISKIPDDILNWAIKCEITGRPFRIVPQELDFYRKHNIPIPHFHPDERHRQRMALRNPRKLFDRKCDKCGIDIKTTYGLEGREIVYCEKCYNKEVY